MAEGFEPYHVPQQSRRDKLRVLPGQTHPPCLQPDSPQHHHLHSSPLLPLYDPTCASFMSSSDFLTCQPSVKPEAHVIHHQHLMGDFVSHNSSNSSSSAAVPADAFRNHHTHNHHHQHNPFSDPHPSNDNFPPNPEINNNHFLYPPQNLQPLREFDHHHQHPPPFSHDQPSPLVFKPEPLSLSLSSSKRYGSSSMNYNSLNSAVHVASGSTDHTIGSRSSVPLGPFTGYASILKGSRFLKPAQHLLEEFCDVGSREIYNAKVMAAADSSAFLDPTMDNLSPAEDNDTGGGDGVERTARKSMLISMLDEVFRRYKQYYQQMQAVVTSFEYVAGLGNAAPYANFAIKAMTRHFKCLKHAIAEQLQSRNRDSNVTHFGQGKDETQMLHNTRGSYIQTSSIRYSDLADQHPPVWRPQRGLPERAVTVLRGWLFEHFLHPYPTDSDKVMLAKQTGLSRSQVSNWFINARVRLWKPMVEEIHMLETRQAEKGLETMERDGNRSSDQDHLPSQNSIASNRPSTTTHRVQETASKRTRNEIPVPMRTMGMSSEQMNLSYTNLPTHVNVGHVGMNNMAGGGTSNGVSLTLGLHQNNGVGFSESFPINAAQRFGLGLDGNGGQGYAMGGFEAQNRHFGRDVIGGQLLHDFVG